MYFFLSVFLFPVFLSLRTFAGYVEKGIISAHFLHTCQIVMDVQTQTCKTVQSNTLVVFIKPRSDNVLDLFNKTMQVKSLAYSFSEACN